MAPHKDLAGTRPSAVRWMLTCGLKLSRQMLGAEAELLLCILPAAVAPLCSTANALQQKIFSSTIPIAGMTPQGSHRDTVTLLSLVQSPGLTPVSRDLTFMVMYGAYSQFVNISCAIKRSSRSPCPCSFQFFYTGCS